MLKFIFTMLFYGAFLGCLAILCLWFFAGMTIQQSFDWLGQKLGIARTQVVSSVEDSVQVIKRAGTITDRQLENVARKLQ